MNDNQQHNNHNTAEATHNSSANNSTHNNDSHSAHASKESNHSEGASHGAKHSDLMDYPAAKSAAMTLRAINHKLRQQIIALLDDNKRMNVTDIYVKLRLEQSVASQHLAILRRADIVKTVREGKFIHYALNYDRMAEVSKFIKELTAGEKAAA